jgi:predicted ATP-binding protein involved in virulence
MKIKRVSVTKLFGMFDHVISFNLDEHITIIHGSNGLGKTTLLRMINGFFNNRLSELRSIPFEAFQIDFDDQSSLRITRASFKGKDSTKPGSERTVLLAVYTRSSDKEPLQAELEVLGSERNFRLARIFLENYVKGLKKVGTDRWSDKRTGELLTGERLVESYWDQVPTHLFEELEKSEDLLIPRDAPQSREWLAILRSRIDVRFIETQRLVAPPRPELKPREDSPNAMTPSVAVYSIELASVIQNKFNEYAGLSQSLDQTFPRRVIDKNLGETLALDELREKLLSVEKKRARMREAGLLDKQPHDFEGVPTSIDDVTRSVLSVYAADMEKKLGVFNDVVEKIELLKQLVNDHSLSKELLISRERGFSLRSTRTSEPLEATQLSSGEQHELVLFYELLFRLKPNSLILIDEPEISLHPDWQLRFLDDLASIIKLTQFDVLIATHSPMIINQRWDLAVELVE